MVGSKKEGRTSHTDSDKKVYLFGKTQTDGNAGMKALLGGKGANLAENASLGAPVPPGLTITTAVCRTFYAAGKQLPNGLIDEVRMGLQVVEQETGKGFGHIQNPLLVSVRSGAAISMPGMMETILNLGLNDQSVVGLANKTNNERQAYDSYRRLIQMFGGTAKGIDNDLFEESFTALKQELGVTEDTEVSPEGLKKLCEDFKRIYLEQTGEPFPQDPFDQLRMAIIAVFESWMGNPAIEFREREKISADIGTAVTVQSMVFGNSGSNSCSGVAFSRNGNTGENILTGEFLINAQGEEVVAGTRTPLPCSQMADWNPAMYAELIRVCKLLEKHYGDLQDIEFTVDDGVFYLLQSRAGKRSMHASVKIACDMVSEGLISRKAAVLRQDPYRVKELFNPRFDEKEKKKAQLLGKGIGASGGAAVGKIAFTSEEVSQILSKDPEANVILVRNKTSAEDVGGMKKAAGILTSTGGKTSHAAVVALGWNVCCVVGASALRIDEKNRTVTIGDQVLTDQDEISVDGSTGEFFKGIIPVIIPDQLSEEFTKLMGWADEDRTLEVWANVDTPEDALKACELGAQGIGLVRTEHMFFENPERLLALQRMILAETKEARAKALAIVLDYQIEDFIGILTAMNGYPVTIRLLDPPLHEFLPEPVEEQVKLAADLGISLEFIQQRLKELHETNPMMGHRGCRLCISYPEILAMQVRAIITATIKCHRKGIDAQPYIMHPLVSMVEEFDVLLAETKCSIQSVKRELGFHDNVAIPIGTMIETPRAALTAGDIAAKADFFSFGTNDLTQMTFGGSRDDCPKYFPTYEQRGILKIDPYISIDQKGVGKLVSMAVESAREVKQDFKLGICGTHGGDPASIKFFDSLELDYVSCVVPQLLSARLAAAQAAIIRREDDLS